MTWFAGVVAYVVIWAVVLFMVLPFGVQTPDEANVTLEPGQASSAPVRPRIGLKLAITTVIAALLWLAFYYAATSDLVTFRPPRG